MASNSIGERGDGGVKDGFGLYLAADFDAEGHAQKLLESGTAVADQLAELSSSAALLDQRLKQQIGSHHGKLLTQATSIESLEGVLETLTHHICMLKGSAERISTKTCELFDKTEVQTKQLSRMHHTCNYLRAIIRIMQLDARLGTGKGPDIVKTSTIISEMVEICADVDLHGIEAVDREVNRLPVAIKELKLDGRNSLQQGLRTQHQAVVGNALQVFANLGCLEEEIVSFFKGQLDEVDQSLVGWGKGGGHSTIDSSTSSGTGKGSGAPGAAVGSQVPTPSSAVIRANLWTDVQRFIDVLLGVVNQTDVMGVVLAKKKHSGTHRPIGKLLSVAFDQQRNKLWKDVGAVIGKRLSQLTGLVRQTLESEYPKLLRLLSDVLARLGSAPDVLQQKPGSSDGDDDGAVNIRHGLTTLEIAYLRKSLSRMLDAVNLAFDGQSPPRSSEIEAFGKMFNAELSVVQFDRTLCGQVAANVAKTIRQFASKSEDMLSTGGDASQIIDRPSAGQKRNAAIVNALDQMRAVIAEQVLTSDKLDPCTRDGLCAGCAALTAQMDAAVLPLMRSIDDALSAIIETIHHENFSSDSVDGAGQQQQQCSLFMRELQSFVARVKEDHLSLFTCVDFIHEQGVRVAKKACRLFVLHASLVRPLGEGGRLRLAADFAQMEMAVSPLLRRSIGLDLGAEYATLRAVRPMLFQSPSDIAKSKAIGNTVPYWLSVHLIISSSPPELHSPHASADWSIARYAEWFDEHESAAERLQFLRGTLESYARSETRTSYVDTYPILVDLLKSGAEQVNTTVPAS